MLRKYSLSSELGNLLSHSWRTGKKKVCHPIVALHLLQGAGWLRSMEVLTDPSLEDIKTLTNQFSANVLTWLREFPEPSVYVRDLLVTHKTSKDYFSRFMALVYSALNKHCPNPTVSGDLLKTILDLQGQYPYLFEPHSSGPEWQRLQAHLNVVESRVWRLLGRLSEAEESATRALKTVQQFNQLPTITRVEDKKLFQNNLATILIDQDKFKEANQIGTPVRN